MVHVRMAESCRFHKIRNTEIVECMTMVLIECMERAVVGTYV